MRRCRELPGFQKNFNDQQSYPNYGAMAVSWYNTWYSLVELEKLWRRDSRFGIFGSPRELVQEASEMAKQKYEEQALNTMASCAFVVQNFPFKLHLPVSS